jgi:hypothetical protein
VQRYLSPISTPQISSFTSFFDYLVSSESTTITACSWAFIVNFWLTSDRILRGEEITIWFVDLVSSHQQTSDILIEQDTGCEIDITNFNVNDGNRIVSVIIMLGILIFLLRY